MAKAPTSWVEDVVRIGILWGCAIAIAAIWIILDRTPPAWDQAEHLSLSMNFWWTLTHSPWWTADGWRHLWMLSPKYPPVLYLVTAGVHTLLGPGPDIAIVANALFGLILLIATYGMGRHLFSPQIGLLAVGLTLLMPRLIKLSLDFQLDYALTALVVLSFWSLTVWRDASSPLRQWLWVGGFGLSYGLALMTKQSALLFLLVPLVWVAIATLWRRRWGRLLQLVVAGLLRWASCCPGCR
jgi:4-amino-4-deoxy-L-arabinose transferase-like glycosyltransferase